MFVSIKFTSFKIKQYWLKTNIVTASTVLYYGCKQNFTFKNSFNEIYHFANDFQLGYWTFTKLCRKKSSRNFEEAVTRIDRRLRGIKRAILNQPSQEVLSNFRQKLLTLELNYERLRYTVYATDYRRRLEMIVGLSTTIDNLLAPQPHQQITAGHALVYCNTSTIKY